MTTSYWLYFSYYYLADLFKPNFQSTDEYTNISYILNESGIQKDLLGSAQPAIPPKLYEHYSLWSPGKKGWEVGLLNATMKN